MNDCTQFVEVLSFEVFIIKNCVVLSSTSVDTLKHDCVIKTREIFHFFL